jgi:cyclopropane fatty-acyl-phospholipid synthase-like methyltransferase
MESTEQERQAAFFNQQRNQYATGAVIQPPLHTRMEVERVLRQLTARNVPRTGHVLDFGAGTGRLTIPLLEGGYRVTAVDVSQASLDSLQDVAAQLGLRDLETTQELPEDAQYDAVVGADILHHVAMPEYLPRLRRLLKKGGVMAFSEPGALNPTWYVYLPLAFDWSVEKGVTTCTTWNLTRQLRRAGFEDIEISGFGLVPRSLTAWSERLCRLNDDLGDVLPARLIAYRYTVSARTNAS